MNGFQQRTDWIVLTGAPSSGKTSVLEELERQGYAIEHEVARAYIEACLGTGLSVEEVRADKENLQKEILSKKIEREDKMLPENLSFLDRAIPDSIAYYQLAQMDPKEAFDASYRYRYKYIFIFDRLPVINDGVRVETEEVAEYLDKQIEKNYLELDYKPVRVPVLSIEERVEFILDHIGELDMRKCNN